MPTATRELESLKQEIAELRSERDAACAQCRLQAQELHTLRQQLQAREDERRELVNRLSSSLGSYLIDCNLGSEELQRGLEAITATRDAALQSAQQERDSLQILKQQLASMRAERDDAQARLKAEEQRWSSRMGELASGAATGAELASAIKAVQWLASGQGKSDGGALLRALKPLVVLRAAKYELDSQAAKVERLDLRQMPKAQGKKRSADDAFRATAPSTSELGEAIASFRKLAEHPEELPGDPWEQGIRWGFMNQALRSALHPLVEAHLREEKASPAFRITSMLGDRARWPEALRLLRELRQQPNEKRPKLGAYQRWVRELDVAEGDPQELLMLDAVMRLAAGFGGAPATGATPAGRMEALAPWAPQLGSPKPKESKEPKVKEVPVEGHNSMATKLFSLISLRKAGSSASMGGSWRVLAHEKAADRMPPNHYDLDGLAGRSPRLTIGYRPDVPISSQLDERAHNVVLMANEVQNKSLFDRVKHLLPSQLGDEKLLVLNRRWRFYRYFSGNLYRKHLDGAWPASGITLEDGQERYVYDAHGGGTRNDDFEGGCTTFFTPKVGEEGTLHSRPIRPTIGSASVFPHGDCRVPLLHEGSAVTSGTKYLLRTDVETPEELKHQARLRGLARQLGGLGGLGGQGLVEAQEAPTKEPKMSKGKKRVKKSSLKGKAGKAEEDGPPTSQGQKGKKVLKQIKQPQSGKDRAYGHLADEIWICPKTGAESRIEEASEQAVARRRTEEETWRQTATRCAEAEAAKKQLQDQLAEERACSNELRVEVQSLSRGKKELQMELERSQALSKEEFYDEGQPDMDRLQRQLFRAKQEIDSLRVRTQVKESLLEQTEGELQKNVRRLGELSAEKAQLQWEAAEQGKSELQLRQRLQTAEAKLLEAVRENRAEGEASFLLSESKKQLATLEDSKRSLIEGLEWEKAEVQRLKSELQRVSQERGVAQGKEATSVVPGKWSWWKRNRNHRARFGDCNVSVLISKPVYFSETFGSGWESRWTSSEWKKSDGTQGTWKLSPGKWYKDESEDQGIQTAEDSRFFGLSAGFDSFSNAGKELIIQYQAKYEKDIECGGGYVKVGPKLSDPTAFGDPTPYNIMFGPDKCGYTKRTHLIFNYKSKNVLKKSDLAYKQEGEGTSHVYRLVLKPDNTARVEIDGEKIYEGSLKEDWELLAPKEIKDPEDKKPSDWVDDSMMDDPEDKKPENWVEEKRIVDDKAKKPDDWDDEEDGEWEAPMIDNPEYKGEWTVKRISNPAYKGKWEAKMIANPEFVDDDNLYKYDDFGFIGFDLWQVKGNTIFDNVIITDDVAEADKFVAKWKALSEVEKEKKKEEDDAKAEEAKKAADTKEDDDDDDEAELGGRESCQAVAAHHTSEHFEKLLGNTEEEALPDPVERCRKRIRLRRRKVEASLQRALEEDARGREERLEAHEARLKRIMVERWHKRQEEEALLQRAMRRERDFLRSLGLPAVRKRRTPARSRHEAFQTEEAAYLAKVGTQSHGALPNARLMDCKLPSISSLQTSNSEGRLHILPVPRRLDGQSRAAPGHGALSEEFRQHLETVAWPTERARLEEELARERHLVLAETQQFASVPLLGGSADWRFSSWRAITDQVRGGVSTAALEPCAAGARFTGNLDPSKLSAGFAGMNLDVKVLPVAFSDLDGLKLGVLDADP
eukprot:s6_g8.t4